MSGESAVSQGLEKAGQQISRAARRVADEGVGPVQGSIPYAEDRLEKALARAGLPHADGNAVRRAIHTAVRQPDSDERQVVEATVARIIKESVAAAGTTGFVTGLGGLTTMWVTIPADVAGNFVINARMVGAIAHLRGYDLNDPHAQAMFLLTVAGSSGQAMASTLGIRLGQEGAKQAIKAIPIRVIRDINKRAGFYLVAKYGTKRAAATLVKAVPVVGGVVSGGINVALTASIGKTASRAFPY